MSLLEPDSPLQIGDCVRLLESKALYLIIKAESNLYSLCNRNYVSANSSRSEFIKRSSELDLLWSRKSMTLTSYFYRHGSNDQADKYSLVLLEIGNSDYVLNCQKKFIQDHPYYSYGLSSHAKIKDEMWIHLKDRIGRFYILPGFVNATKVLEQWTPYRFVEEKDSLPFETAYPSTRGKWVLNQK